MQLVRNYKYDIGDKLFCKDGSYNLIVEKTTGDRGESAYMCKCKNEHTYKKLQTKINGKCPYCINYIVEKGVNDISTTNQDMFSMIKDKNFSYTHHDNSTKKTEFICPICSRIIFTSPCLVKNRGLSCPHCSDGISYGEKFIMNLLEEFGVEYITQFSSKNAVWCRKYKYDFYIERYDTIIEVHGLQHYKDTTWSSFEDIHRNDIDKKTLAQEHITNYIELDVQKSELNYIKRSILYSDILQILKPISYDETNIPWKRLHKKSVSPIIERIVYQYNNYTHDITELSKILHIARNTIVRYLKEAALLNMCNYNPIYEKEKTLKENHSKNSERASKPLICLEDSKVFRNARILENHSVNIYKKHLYSSNISAVCNGKDKSLKGLHFQFITRQMFNDIKDNTPNLAFGDRFDILEDVV